MRVKLFLISLLLGGITLTISAQEATSLKVEDTRDIDDLPNFNKKSVRYDFKRNVNLGLPSIGTDSKFAGVFTISPWHHYSGGFNYQLAFHNDGLYYRQGHFEEEQWRPWRRMMIGETNGDLFVHGNNLRIGEINQAGDLSDPSIGAVTKYMNLDFSGYRDTKKDHVGARISAYRSIRGYNGGIQNTGLIFYVNPIGTNPGEVDLKESLRITPAGYIGIGTSKPKYLLDVKGTMRANSILIESVDKFADFVFEEGYILRSLAEVEKHILEKGHLPEIPNAQQVKDDGLDLVKMQVQLLQKIEELTLYTIQQEKRIQELESKLKE